MSTDRVRATGWAAPKNHYAVPVLFNPYTGDPRDVRDVQSDPQGILIVPPGNVKMQGAQEMSPTGLPQQTEVMTMRDCFASAAMQAVITRGDDSNRPGIAEWAYSMADAMLKEREKQHTKG